MSPRRPAEPATSRVARLLTMVPWLVSRQGIPLTEAAEGLGVSERQLRDDLDLLFMCGYGPMTDELIEVSYEQDRVFVTNADTIRRPLRLSVAEAVTLITGLRALQAAGVAPSDAVARALAKVEGAAAALPGLDALAVADDDGADLEVRQVVTEALRQRRRLHLAYLVPSRDERTERDVDPMRVISQDGHWYLEGWCHSAKDTRLFRLDRIEALSVLDEDGTPPEGARSRDLSSGAYPADVGHDAVTLRLRPAARWVAEYYPVQELREDGEDLVVTLAARDEDWLARLVLRGGGEIGIEAPASAAEAVMARAQAALGEYTG